MRCWRWSFLKPRLSHLLCKFSYFIIVSICKFVMPCITWILEILIIFEPPIKVKLVGKLVRKEIKKCIVVNWDWISRHVAGFAVIIGHFEVAQGTGASSIDNLTPTHESSRWDGSFGQVWCFYVEHRSRKGPLDKVHTNVTYVLTASPKFFIFASWLLAWATRSSQM